ncbi:MAG TPA: addiction module protein [Terracidiphilus sp.]
MARTARQILEEARQLPPEQIDWLVESLLIKDCGDEPLGQIDAAWEAEVKRRLDEVDSGAVQMIPGEQVLAGIDVRLAARQRK